MTLALLGNIVEGLRNGPNLPYARAYWANTSTPKRRAARLAHLDRMMKSDSSAQSPPDGDQ